jgi:hypothetical protein
MCVYVCVASPLSNTALTGLSLTDELDTRVKTDYEPREKEEEVSIQREKRERRRS